MNLETITGFHNGMLAAVFLLRENNGCIGLFCVTKMKDLRLGNFIKKSSLFGSMVPEV